MRFVVFKKSPAAKPASCRELRHVAASWCVQHLEQRELHIRLLNIEQLDFDSLYLGCLSGREQNVACVTRVRTRMHITPTCRLMFLGFVIILCWSMGYLNNLQERRFQDERSITLVRRETSCRHEHHRDLLANRLRTAVRAQRVVLALNTVWVARRFWRMTQEGDMGPHHAVYIYIYIYI